MDPGRFVRHRALMYTKRERLEEREREREREGKGGGGGPLTNAVET